MREIIVACCQFKPVDGDVRANREKVGGLLESASKLSAQVVVFPEVCIQGICAGSVIAQTAESIPGPSSELLCSWTKEYQLYSVLGMAEKAGGRFFNSAVLAGPNGKLLGVYRKTHLWTTERDIYTPGSEYPVFETEIGKLCIWICYDTRFPEVAGAYSKRGASVAFVPTAWLSRDVEHWRLATRARALDNFMYVCGADEIVESDFHQACGASIVCNPEGNVLAEAQRGVETIISAAIDPLLCEKLREAIPVLKDARN